MNNPNYYAIIPADVRYNNNLSFLERFLYCEITALSNAYGYCFATNKYFADLYQKNDKTISRALKNLEKEKHIILEYEKKGSLITNRKIYALTQKQASDIFVTGVISTSDIFVTGEEQKIISTIRKKVTHNNITYRDIFNIITNIKKNTFFEPCLFERFYQSYPKKQNRDKAEKAFIKLNPDKALFEKMLNSLELQKKSVQWQNKKYIPLPSTWLNGKRWEDEITDFAESSSNDWSEVMEELG